MTDIYGAEALPAPASLQLDGRVPRAADRALDAIASYLQAVLEARIGAQWATVYAGSKGVVIETFTVRPQECTINPAQLPALFVWRGSFQATREAEDYLTTRTQLGIMWLLWWPDPLKRERYLPFQGIVSKAIHESLARGRHPAWVVPGDATPGAATRGSVLVDHAGLLMPIDAISGQLVDVSIVGSKDAPPVDYKALSITATITERMVRDPALFTVPIISTSDPQNGNPGSGLEPAALDLFVSQSNDDTFDNTTEQLKPQP
jgi:hypothetical protein